MSDRFDRLRHALSDRVLVLDSPPESVLCHMRGIVEETDLRRKVADLPDLSGLPFLNVEQPELVEAIHQSEIDAGADILRTNTYGIHWETWPGNSFDRAHCRRVNLAGARIASTVARRADRDVLVAGVIGPGRSMLLGPDPMEKDEESASSRSVSWANRGVSRTDPQARHRSEVDAYSIAVSSLIEGGVDLLMIEKMFPGVDGPAVVLETVRAVEEEHGTRIPVISSFAMVFHFDDESRTRYWRECLRAAELANGLGFRRSADHEAYREIARWMACSTDLLLLFSPSLGDPDESIEVIQKDEPGVVAEFYRALAEEGLVNIVGGGLGSTSVYTRCIAAAVRDFAPRRCRIDN